MRTVAGTRPLPKRYCPGCDQLKPLSADYWYRSGRYWQTRCKTCFVGTYQGKHVDQVRELKDGQPCMDCRERFPFYVLDYDHRPGEVKRFEIGKAVRGSYKWETILAEIAKCDLICANCHRKRTWHRATEERA